MFFDIACQLFRISLARLGIHRKRCVNSISHSESVPGIHDQRAVQRLSSASKFRQDHDAIAFLLTRDIFVRHEIHTIASAGDEAHIADGVQRAELVEFDGTVQKMNRHTFDRAKSAVNATDSLVHRRTQVLVLFHILSRRYSDLNQHHFPDPFWMLFQERFDALELLRHAFDIVESINPHNDLDTFKSARQCANALSDHRLLQRRLKLMGINTDRIRADLNTATTKVSTIRVRGYAQDTRTRG